MRNTLRIGKIAGIDIGVHYSWFVGVTYFSWSLRSRFLPSLYEGWSPATFWAMGVAAALLLYASVLVHELAHSVVARRLGVAVEGITLFMLGGASSLKTEPKRPRDEFVISIAGPAMSLVLAGLFAVVAAVPFRLSLFDIPEGTTPVATLVWYLWILNGAVAVFNLLPAFPMDGGRVVRAMVWAVSRSRSRATVVAARGGQLMAILLLAYAVLELMRADFEWGLWAGLMGWFLFGVASASIKDVRTETALSGLLVRNLMDPSPRTVGPETPIGEAVSLLSSKTGDSALPVCDGDRLIGIVTRGDARRIPRDQWPAASVRYAMTSVPPLSVGPEDELAPAYELMDEHSLDQAPVLQGGRLIGLLRAQDVAEYLRRGKKRGIGRPSASAGDVAR